MSSNLEVSVVMPCLNEARSVGLCVDTALTAMREAGIDGEVVVADNGSTDGSIALAEQHGARVVHASQRGYGQALRKGIDEARGRFVIFGDADASYDFAQVPEFVAKWREGYDVVMGNRFAGGIAPGAMPWHHRYIGNPVLTGILNLLFRAHIGDAHCGLRGFDAAVYRQMDLRTTGMEFASEFVIKAVKLGVRIADIPVRLGPDLRGRPPHLRSFRDGWRHLRFMLLYAPNWLFLGPGALLTAGGIAMILWLLPGPRHFGGAVLDVHTMLFGLILALLGVEIASVGLFVRVFSYCERFDHRRHSLERWLKTITLEQGLLVGAALALTGLVGDGWVFYTWASSGFGELSQVRAVIFWSLWLFAGVQVIFTSIFLSILGISRGTYIGDYDLK